MIEFLTYHSCLVSNF